MLKHTLAILALLPAAALAGGYAVPNVNPRDLAMGGSRVAAQDSAAAVFSNPAALSTLEGLSVSAAISGIDNKSTWHDPGNLGLGAPADMNSGLSHLAPAPAVYASWGARLPNEMRYGVGVGFAVPFGGNVFWPDGWAGDTDIRTVERRVFGTYLTAGFEPLPWLRVGGGFIWYRGTEELSQRLVTTQAIGTLATAGNGFSYDVSAELQPFEPLRLAIDYKHKSTLGLEGHAHWSGNPPAELAPLTLDQTVSHQLTVPNTLAVGASYRVVPSLLVTGAFTWDRFIVYDEDLFVGGAGARIQVPRNYHNGYTWRLGAEYSGIDRLKLRVGGLRDVAPTPPEWLSPTIPDSNVWGASLGAGYEVIRGLTVEAGYFHAFYDQVTTPRAANGLFNVFPATYDSNANIFSVGVTWAPEIGRQPSTAR